MAFASVSSLCETELVILARCASFCRSGAFRQHRQQHLGPELFHAGQSRVGTEKQQSIAAAVSGHGSSGRYSVEAAAGNTGFCCLVVEKRSTSFPKAETSLYSSLGTHGRFMWSLGLSPRLAWSVQVALCVQTFRRVTARARSDWESARRGVRDSAHHAA